jgi:signal transduction histidine kinase
MLTLPSPYPIYEPDTKILHDGSTIPASGFCRKWITQSKCLNHYAQLEKQPAGYYQCPFGFTSRSFRFLGKLWVITGTIAHPRFGTQEERRLAKDYPDTRTARADIEALIRFFSSLEKIQTEVIEQSAKVLPQAFHELRKLNSAVLQHAEREKKLRGDDSPNLVTIMSAAELMRNNFDILEAISNIETMMAIPRDSAIDVFALVYKVKKIFEVRASERGARINITGDVGKAFIRGSQKSFPIVPAVLMENAIKYGLPDSTINARVSIQGSNVEFTVENRSKFYIHPTDCFDRGARYAPEVEGGGFGLFLARKIVDCHNGTIQCEASHGLIRMIVTIPAHL